MVRAFTGYERGTGVQVWACSRCSYHPDYIDGTLSGVPSFAECAQHGRPPAGASPAVS